MKNVFSKVLCAFLVSFATSCDNSTTEVVPEKPALEQAHIMIDWMKAKESFEQRFYNSEGTLIGSKDTTFLNGSVYCSNSFGKIESSIMIPVQETKGDTFLLSWSKGDTSVLEPKFFRYDYQDYRITVVLDKANRKVKHLNYSYSSTLRSCAGGSIENIASTTVFSINDKSYSHISSDEIIINCQASDLKNLTDEFVNAIESWTSTDQIVPHQSSKSAFLEFSADQKSQSFFIKLKFNRTDF
ncbi:MAG: hypothetical protein V4642_02810 [Bacteroidota bacterium]